MLVQFGFSPFKMKKAELIATLNSFLIEQYSAGRKVLLVIDEAQNLSLKVLEEIRLLSGIESTKEKVLRIILAGQPELNEKLDSPELVQLAQRVRLRFHLGALSRDDVTAYVRHRLEIAGAQGREIFAEETFAELYKYSGGVPRLVNTLCDTAMMAAFNEDRDSVTLKDMESAIAELQWVEFSARASTMATRALTNGTAATTGDRPAKPMAKMVLSTDGKAVAELHLVPGRKVDRPHPGQRPADRQQIHQPASLPARHGQRRHHRGRGPEQHQWHRGARQTGPPLHAARRRRGDAGPARNPLPRRPGRNISRIPTTICRGSKSTPRTRMRDEDAPPEGAAGAR